MKTVIKGKPARAAKRDLFAELREGMSALPKRGRQADSA